MARLRFVQADPIRSPATAQDLILRHRVKNYRAGDLDARYPELAIEEDYLYAYGFVSRDVRSLLHPRKKTRTTKLEEKIIAVVREMGETHPRALEEQFGKKRVVNAWGGFSKETTRALDSLHYRGHLRIARREKGTRVYAIADAAEALDPEERLRSLILVIANILAPVPLRTLHANIARFKHLGDPRAAVRKLLAEGQLEKHVADSIDYVFPPSQVEAQPRAVRILAPFDPLVWDRHRFEHLWGWKYRFEAYTPVKKRVRGYYAMPLLFGSAVVGWVNASVESGRLIVRLGYAEKKPADRAFEQHLEQEIERMRTFLVKRSSS
jgi:hypothetical protein